MLGHVVEAVSGQPLSAFLDERLFRPLKMADTGFKVPQANWSRIAEPLRKEEQFLDMKIDPSNDLAGEGGVSTAADYLRFCQMMLNGGTPDGRRYLNPTTVKLMTSDHLGNRPVVPASPGISLMGLDGYTFGLGLFGPARARPRGRAGFRRRVHVGRLRWNVVLDRSNGATSSRFHGADPRIYSHLLLPHD